MHNLKTATKFLLWPREISWISFYNEQKISKPPKIPENRPRVSPSLFTCIHTQPLSQSKHGFVPRSLARFQAANKQRNNSTRWGGWFLEPGHRKRRVGSRDLLLPLLWRQWHANTVTEESRKHSLSANHSR